MLRFLKEGSPENMTLEITVVVRQKSLNASPGWKEPRFERLFKTQTETHIELVF